MPPSDNVYGASVQFFSGWPLLSGTGATNINIVVCKAAEPRGVHYLLALSACGRPKVTAAGGSALLVRSGNAVIWRAALSQNDSIYTFQFPGSGLACGQNETLCISAQAGGTGVVIDVAAVGHTRVVL